MLNQTIITDAQLDQIYQLMIRKVDDISCLFPKAEGLLALRQDTFDMILPSHCLNMLKKHKEIVSIIEKRYKYLSDDTYANGIHTKINGAIAKANSSRSPVRITADIRAPAIYSEKWPSTVLNINQLKELIELVDVTASNVGSKHHIHAFSVDSDPGVGLVIQDGDALALFFQMLNAAYIEFDLPTPEGLMKYLTSADVIVHPLRAGISCRL